MSPLADAVCLVDREKADADACKAGRDVSKVESLGRKVKQSYFSPRCACETIRHLRRGERAVDERSRQIARLEGVDLILHQGNQRRHNYCQSGQYECGDLIAH